MKKFLTIGLIAAALINAIPDAQARSNSGGWGGYSARSAGFSTRSTFSMGRGFTGSNRSYGSAHSGSNRSIMGRIHVYREKGTKNYYELRF